MIEDVIKDVNRQEYVDDKLQVWQRNFFFPVVIYDNTSLVHFLVCLVGLIPANVIVDLSRVQIGSEYDI